MADSRDHFIISNVTTSSLLDYETFPSTHKVSNYETAIQENYVTSTPVIKLNVTLEEYIREGFQESLPNTIMYCIMFIIGSFSNYFLLYQLYRTSKYHTKMNYLIKHLTISDLYVVNITIPFEIVWRIKQNWIYGETMCKLCSFSRAFGLYLTSMIVICVSLDRYYAVVHPLSIYKVKSRNRIFLAVSYVIAFCCSMPNAIVFHVDHHPDVIGFSQCWSHNYWSSTTSELIYNLSSISVLYFIPLLFIIVCYSTILHVIDPKSKKSGANSVRTNYYPPSTVAPPGVPNIEIHEYPPEEKEKESYEDCFELINIPSSESSQLSQRDETQLRSVGRGGKKRGGSAASASQSRLQIVGEGILCEEGKERDGDDNEEEGEENDEDVGERKCQQQQKTLERKGKERGKDSKSDTDTVESRKYSRTVESGDRKEQKDNSSTSPGMFSLPSSGKRLYQRRGEMKMKRMNIEEEKRSKKNEIELEFMERSEILKDEDEKRNESPKDEDEKRINIHASLKEGKGKDEIRKDEHHHEDEDQKMSGKKGEREKERKEEKEEEKERKEERISDMREIVISGENSEAGNLRHTGIPLTEISLTEISLTGISCEEGIRSKAEQNHKTDDKLMDKKGKCCNVPKMYQSHQDDVLVGRDSDQSVRKGTEGNLRVIEMTRKRNESGNTMESCGMSTSNGSSSNEGVINVINVTNVSNVSNVSNVQEPFDFVKNSIEPITRKEESQRISVSNIPLSPLPPSQLLSPRTALSRTGTTCTYRSTQATHNRSQILTRAKKKTTRTSLAIVLTFICCWTPYSIIVVIFALYPTKPDTLFNPWIEPTLIMLAIANSCINPFVHSYYIFCDFFTWKRSPLSNESPTILGRSRSVKETHV